MDEHAQSVYLGEVERQCAFALGALGHLNRVLQLLQSGDLREPGAHQFAQSEVFRSIHSFLTHASNVSRLLWPPGSSRVREERGEILRRALNIADGDHPLKSRRLRDHLEHFDERLDDWQRSSSRRNFVQDNIGPWGLIAGIDEGDVMRWYDQVAKRVIFRGESFDLQALATAIDTLRPIASEACARAWHAAGQRSATD